MGRAIKFDAGDFMNEYGEVSGVPPPVRVTAGFLRGIVYWVTLHKATIPMSTNITCRHAGGPSNCGGQIAAHILPGTDKIRYVCGGCGETGRIIEWKGTPWDLTERDYPGRPFDGLGPGGLTREKPALPLDLRPPGPIEKKILDYLQLHPRASDPLEGVYSWWVRGPSEKYCLPEVQQALDNVSPSGRKNYMTNTKRNN
jgi:hypothetical protein